MDEVIGLFYEARFLGIILGFLVTLAGLVKQRNHGSHAYLVAGLAITVLTLAFTPGDNQKDHQRGCTT